MSFTNLYLNAAASGANDLNSGSTTAAPTHTYGGGTFVRATGVYTVASGNPSTDGFVAAGDYVSIYTTSGRTVATFVAKVGSTTSTTIVTDTTIVYGLATTVSEAANASSLTIGGSWSTQLPLGATASAGGLGTFTAAQSTKINIKGDRTLAASITVSMAGATAAPIWLSGYNTTPGDLDNDTTNTLAKPVWTFNSTINLTASGTHQIWSGISFTGSVAGIFVTMSGASQIMNRVRIENTSSNAAAVAIRWNANSVTMAYSWCKCPTTATTTGVIQVSGTASFLGVVAEGGGIAGWNCTTNATRLISCVGLNNTGNAVLATTALLQIVGMTIYNSSSDGIKWSSTPGVNSMVAASMFSTCGGAGINNALGTNVNNVYRACNDFYSCSGGAESGFGDSPAFFQQTDSANPLTSATNVTPIATSNARNHGFPGIFENETFISYAWIGSVQPNAFGSGFFLQ